MADFLMTSNSLLDCYNSSLNNLRSGFSNWNRSVNQRFDPEEWMAVFGFNGNDMLVVTNDNPYMRYEMNRFKFRVSGFYLLSEPDGIMLFGLTEIGKLLGVQYIQLAMGSYEYQGNFSPIINSSANSFDFRTMNSFVWCKPRFFYLYKNQIYELYSDITNK